jgi:hypothetical protein
MIQIKIQIQIKIRSQESPPKYGGGMALIPGDLQRVNNDLSAVASAEAEAGRQKNKAGCYPYLFPPPK